MKTATKATLRFEGHGLRLRVTREVGENPFDTIEVERDVRALRNAETAMRAARLLKAVGLKSAADETLALCVNGVGGAR